MRILKGLALTLIFFLVTGFDLSTHSISTKEIRSGGPPKDGIPALSNPVFVKAGHADFLKDNDKVLGVAVKGAAKAYPIKILNWHEAVNDRISGYAILATW